MPAFHNALAVFLFIITPILFLAAYFTLLGTVETKWLFLYFTFTLIHTILFTLWFFIVLLDVFEGLKVQNAVERKAVAANMGNKIMTDSMKDAGDLANHSIHREYSKKVDKPMTFREDMFCLLYVSLVKP